MVVLAGKAEVRAEAQKCVVGRVGSGDGGDQSAGSEFRDVIWVLFGPDDGVVERREGLQGVSSDARSELDVDGLGARGGTAGHGHIEDGVIGSAVTGDDSGMHAVLFRQREGCLTGRLSKYFVEVFWLSGGGVWLSLLIQPHWKRTRGSAAAASLNSHSVGSMLNPRPDRGWVAGMAPSDWTVLLEGGRRRVEDDGGGRRFRWIGHARGRSQ